MLVWDDGHSLVAARPRLRDWLAAHVAASRLDRQLAAGRSPEATPALALRAQLLVRSSRRRAVADRLNLLMTRATDPPATPTVIVPPCPDRVQQAAADLASLAHRLLTAGPIAARGVAEANILLSDGCGPLYNRRNCEDLPERVRSIVRDLDPLSSI
jgi:hypothetical protein